MGLSRPLIMLSFKTLLLSSFLSANLITVSADPSTTRKLHLTTTTTANPPSLSSSPSLSPPPPPPPPPQNRSHAAPFRPSIAVVVGVLTTLFSIPFLLLLYAKHCKTANRHEYGHGDNIFRGPLTDRKNSGVDRTVIESLPIFRFGSLRGAAKDGLECAVCLNRFEPTEVLKLLPKCKHAFHVECVDTWLDAHSTCPLCRFRVDPEDVLLLNDAVRIIGQGNHEPPPPPPPPPEPPSLASEAERLRRVSGRHSSAGERGSRNNGGFLQIVVEKAGAKNDGGENVTTRRSLDGWNSKGQGTPKKKTKEAVGVGCFDRRKDGMLLTLDEERRSSDRRRLEHRIIVGEAAAGGGGARTAFHQQRWSDVQPSDLLYLRSEMIMSDSRGLWAASGSRPSVQQQQRDVNHHHQGGRGVINGRSVSEITGLSRWSSSSSSNNHHWRRRRWEERERSRGEREAGVVSRWLAWASRSSTSSSQIPQQRTTTTSLPVVGS